MLTLVTIKLIIVMQQGLCRGLHASDRSSQLMRRIGASRGAAAAVVGAELSIVLAVAVAITVAGVWLGLRWVGGVVS